MNKLLFVFIIFSSFANAAAQLSDKEISQKLIGNWVIHPKEGSSRPSMNAYHADGSIEYTQYASFNCSETVLYVKGEWFVKDKMLYLTATETSDPSRIYIGFKTSDQVMSINAEQMLLQGSNGLLVKRFKQNECF